MREKKHTPEQVVKKLREAEIELARGAYSSPFGQFTFIPRSSLANSASNASSSRQFEKSRTCLSSTVR